MPTRSADLVYALEQAEAAWMHSDLPSLQAATDRVRSQLPCLDEPLVRTLAAQAHRDLGLRAFVERDLESAELSFAAARAILPDWRFPDAMVSAGNPLRDHYRARPAEGPVQTVPPPASGSLSFDGRVGLDRPTGRSTIVQLSDDSGAVLLTALVQPGEALPA